MGRLVEELTSEDRAWACERALSHVQGRYVEAFLRRADTDADAAQRAKQECGTWGSYGPGYGIEGTPRGLEVERGGRRGLVRWREVAAAARGTAQEALF